MDVSEAIAARAALWVSGGARRWLMAAAFAVVAGSTAPALATTVDYSSSGLVSGIEDLVVGSNIYDITFVAGVNYNTAYNNIAVAYSNAGDIVSAIIATLNAEPKTPYNQPNIAGTSGSQSNFVLPSAINSSNVTVRGGDHNAAHGAASLYSALPSGTNFARNGVLSSSYAWAIVTAVPLPAALPLFASGLGALGLFAWRRKRTLAAAA